MIKQQIILNAINFLLNNQNKDGSITLNNDIGFRIWESAICLNTLKKKPNIVDTDKIKNIVDFILRHRRKDGSFYPSISHEDSDFCLETTSMVAIALHGFDYDHSSTLSFINSSVNHNGSWEIGIPFIKEDRFYPSITGFCLWALYTYDFIPSNIDRSIDFILKNQQEDGSFGKSWAYYDCEYYATYSIIKFIPLLLKKQPTKKEILFNVIDKITSYILKNQNDEGSWGENFTNRPSKELRTSLALNTIILISSIRQIELEKEISNGINWLTSFQKNDGSWNGGIYVSSKNKREDIAATCWAIEAINSYAEIFLNNNSKNRKLVIINPYSDYLETIDSPELKRGLSKVVKYEPIALGVIEKLTPMNWEITHIDESFENINYKPVDLVAITAYTCTFNRAIEISNNYRRIGVKTVIGGIHASMLPDESSQYFDIVAVGEAELVWNRILVDFENGTLKKIYKSNHTLDLCDAITPFHHENKYQKCVVYTSKGCPNNCNYCSVSVFNGTKYRNRKNDDVLNEVMKLNNKVIFFADDDILGNKNSGIEEKTKLFKKIHENGVNIIWGGFASINIAQHDDFLKIASKTNCVALYIGLESIMQKNLKDLSKNNSQHDTFQNLSKHYNKMIKKINAHGVLVHGGFIIGNEFDNYENLEKLYNFIKYSYVNFFSVFILTPMPGTKLFERIKSEKRLIFNNFPSDWKHYNWHEITFNPKNMTIEDFNKSITLMKKKLYYSKTTRIIKFFLTLYTTKSFKLAFFALKLNTFPK